MGLRPQVQINVNSSLNLIAPAGPATIAMIGTAQWGPMDEVVTVNSLQQALNVFKEDKSTETLTIIKGLDLAYANGAGTVKAIRIGNGNEDYSDLTLTAGTTSVVTLTGKYKGTYGDNIAVSVTSIASARGVTITDGQTIESYTNGGTGYTSNITLVSAINANSGLVSATSLNNVYLVDTYATTYLSGGSDGQTSLVLTDYTDVMDNALAMENYDVLLTPGITTDGWHSTIVGKLNTREASDDRFSVYFAGVSANEAIATIKARTASGKRFALVAPSVSHLHRVTGEEEVLDGSYLACAYAGKTAQGWPQLSATHKTLAVNGTVVDSSTSKLYYNNGEVESLLENRVVPITLISGAIQPARAVTRNTSVTEVWYEQNIVDIIDYVKKQVLDLSNGYIGQPNLSRIRSVLAKNIDGVLETDKKAEIVNDYLPTDVSEGSSPDTVLVTMTIKPTFLINFIIVTLSVSNVQQ